MYVALNATLADTDDEEDRLINTTRTLFEDDVIGALSPWNGKHVSFIHSLTF